MTRVASIGECMIELKQAGGGLYSRGFGGDTLNTAVYLARLGVAVDYITALGDDPLSAEMIAGWVAEGVGTGRVMRVAGKLPGIYLIGDRCQGRAPLLPLARERGGAEPARSARDGRPAAVARRIRSDLSLGDHARDLRRRGQGAAAGGAARGACSAARASCSTPISASASGPISMSRGRSTREAFETADIVLASTDDLQMLYPDQDAEALLARIPTDEVVLRLAEPASFVRAAGRDADSEQPIRSPRPWSTPRRPVTALPRPISPRGLPAPIRSRRRAPAIVLPAWWSAIPARSFRARRCRRTPAATFARCRDDANRTSCSRCSRPPASCRC